MKLLWLALAAVTIAVPSMVTTALTDDVVVNTQQVISGLVGEWELQPQSNDHYQQRLKFNGGTCACGTWLQKEKTLSTSITFYVEGNELLLQYYYEPNRVGNYRLKQLRFNYKLEGDVLTLTRNGGSQTWLRINKQAVPQVDTD